MLIVVFGLVLLTSTNAFAQSNAPLSPGKPAGVKAAMSESGEGIMLAVMMGTAAVAGIIIAMSHGHAKTTSTVVTSTSP
jgi:hypothetical protein